MKKLTELLHGTVAVHSQPGNGSTFTVELPLRYPSSAATASAAA